MKPKIYMNENSMNECKLEKATVIQSEDNNSTLQNSSHYDKKLLSIQVKVNKNRLYSSAVCLNKPVQIYEQSTCIKHGKIFQYICKGCQQNICHQCLKDLSKHRGHRFQKYRMEKSEDKNKTKRLAKLIYLKKREINLEIFKRAQLKKEVKIKSDMIVEQMKTNIEKVSEFHGKNQLLIAAKLKAYQNQLNSKNSLYETILDQLQKAKPTSFVKQKSFTIQKELLSNISALEHLKERQFPTKTLNISGFVRPNSQILQYTIDSFTIHKLQKAELIFQPFDAFQSSWRLKVYPAGFKGANERKDPHAQYISIYLQRLDGILDECEWIVSMQIQSRKPKLKIKKQFKSKYGKKQSWGYDKYTRTANLYEHQFLSKEDSLKIKIGLAPSRYSEGCNHLQRMIQLKLAVAEEKRKRLQFLKELLLKQTHKQNNYSNSEALGKDEDLQSRSFESTSSIKIQNFQLDQYEKQKKLSQFENTSVNLEEQSRLGQRKNIKTSFPCITLDSKSPRNLIRLISSKNLDLIQSVKKKSHHRSVTFL